MTTAEPKPIVEQKSKVGWKTTEGWITGLAMVLPWVVDSLPQTWKVVANVVSASVYTLARASVKR